MTLHIQGTERTPEVQLMTEPLSLKIQGESFPEDVAVFYGPVINAINALTLEPKGPLSVTMAMVYINSSSIKALYRIFEGVDAYRKAGNEVNVHWTVPEDDDIMEELGEDFKDRFPELEFKVGHHG
ncbi:DUF1987 domain-containing protein [Limnohabitans sp. Rim8]|uniref:DUF1987 domain-containing protein n=1 Tax=Limnohabitans sp. Rim8 TaxID=1100718 RepID=UPI00261300EF|nr:DUF1987 domain-containing protein [Limnohabitans sp. Rim8]